MKNITAIFALLMLTFIATPSMATESETFSKKSVEMFGGMENNSYICSVINNETNMTNLETLIEKLDEITGVSFVSIKDYTNKKGETSDVIVNVGVSYLKAKEKDYNTLSTINVNDLDSDLPTATLEEAKTALMSSLKKPSETHSNGQKNAYTYIGNGIKVHNEYGTIYVNAMKVNKTIKESGEYKEDTRKPLTKAKDFFRHNIMKSTQYRNYSFDSFKEVSISGSTITFQL